jgi:putative glutamine amidotransferase
MGPLIGIGVSIDRGKRLRAGMDYLYVHRGYSRAIREVGGVPVLLSPDTPPSCVESLAGLVLTGGDDLPPRLGMNGTPIGRAEDPERIDHDRQMLDAFANARKPVLGVCYGMQLINLHYGGGLFRSVAEEFGPAIDHGGNGRATQHKTRRVGPSLLLEGLSRTFDTNSIHGQGIRDVAPGFVVTARSDDGLVEAMERGSMFGVEWHPESDATGDPIYRRFIELCLARNTAALSTPIRP